MTTVLIRYGSWESPPMERCGDSTARWAAESVVERFGDSEIGGLYVATSDSGAMESIHFWRSALDTGLGFASPRSFPWTLANSPTGRIARQLDVRGPTFTLIGGADALNAAVAHALDDIGAGLRNALVVALDGVSRDSVALVAIELGPSDAHGVPLAGTENDIGDASTHATFAMLELIERSVASGRT